MAQFRDPVCGILVETDTAIGPVIWHERTYYFCTDEHRQQFESSPERFAVEGEREGEARDASARPRARKGKGASARKGARSSARKDTRTTEPASREAEDSTDRADDQAAATDRAPDAAPAEPNVVRPYTKTDGFTAPRFGSAGSGGLEYEGPPFPLRDDDAEER